MSELALNLIRQAKAEGWTELDLGCTGLTELPEELFELEQLETLIISNEYVNFETRTGSVCKNNGNENVINFIPKSIAKLTNLRRLHLDSSGNLSNSWHINDIAALKNLKKLEWLSLSNNDIQDIRILKNLSQLIFLDLAGNRISGLEKIPTFPKLAALELIYNKIANIENLPELPQLVRLNLSGNKISNLMKLSQFPRLIELNLEENQIRNLKSLPKLPKLKHLTLSGNEINDIKDIPQLAQLEELKLSSNQLKNIEVLKKFPKLVKLDLGFNKISKITSLQGLSHLIELHLNFNQIKNKLAIQKLIQLPNLEYLSLDNNPIEDIPIELLKGNTYFNCLKQLQNYFKDTAQGEQENREIKMILVGNGCVGKTTLAERLAQNPPAPIYKDIETERTHGITIQPWQLADMNIKVNVWDFGGQEVYHATHRMFLSRRTLYLLVWAKETEERPDQPRYEPSYWLDYIADLSQDSRVIIVQNMSDLHGILSLPNESALKEDYANTFQLKFGNSISVSAQTGKGTPTLIAQIKENMEEILQAHRELLPESWANIRDRIEADRARGERTLTKAVYHQYCTEAGISGTSPKTLLEYLHSAGTVYYQQGLFNDEIILDQVWALDGVYAILKSETIQNSTLNHGYFTLADARRIWSAEQYSDEEIEVFIRFMLSCEIAFQRDVNNETRYIVPQLLKEDNRLERAWANRPDALHVRLDYLHLHRSIIERFIVRTAQLSADTYDIWRNAIALDLEGGEALVTAHVESKSIFIRTTGQDKARLLAKIVKEFENIRHFKDRVQQFVSLDSKVWLPKAILEQKRSEGKATFYQDDQAYDVQDYQPFFVHLEKDEALVPLQKRHDRSLLDDERKGWEDKLSILTKKESFLMTKQASVSDPNKEFDILMSLEEVRKQIKEAKEKLGL